MSLKKNTKNMIFKKNLEWLKARSSFLPIIFDSFVDFPMRESFSGQLLSASLKNCSVPSPLAVKMEIFRQEIFR